MSFLKKASCKPTLQNSMSPQWAVISIFKHVVVSNIVRTHRSTENLFPVNVIYSSWALPSVRTKYHFSFLRLECWFVLHKTHNHNKTCWMTAPQTLPTGTIQHDSNGSKIICSTLVEICSAPSQPPRTNQQAALLKWAGPARFVTDIFTLDWFEACLKTHCSVPHQGLALMEYVLSCQSES